MKKSLIVSVILACSLLGYAAPVFACDTEAASTPTSTCITIMFQGRPGVWLDLPTAEKLRAEHMLVPELRLQLGKRDELEAEQQAEIKDLGA